MRKLAAILLLVAADARADVSNMPAGQTSLQFVIVGDPGNAADLSTGSLFGSVPYVYDIGKYDITKSQYAQFLNAKDPSASNTLGLYSSLLMTGIDSNSGAASGSKYTVVRGRENQPAGGITWYDAIRFANWVNNGQGNGDTETGAYTLGVLDANGVPINGPGITRNAGAKMFLPSENEWYKAAYFNPSTQTYFQYGTGSDAAPVAETPSGGSNSANYNNIIGDFTDVGAYASTMSPYGAFDMAGNAWQWNEEPIPFFDDLNRGLRGGSYFDGTPASPLSLFRPPQFGPTSLSINFGFRIAAAIPEPSTLALAAIGLAILAVYPTTCHCQRE